MTDLDKKLQQMALDNWEEFKNTIGEEAITSAKICILRKDNKSYARISIQLGITPRTAQWRAEKCNCQDQEQKTV